MRRPRAFLGSDPDPPGSCTSTASKAPAIPGMARMRADRLAELGARTLAHEQDDGHDHQAESATTAVQLMMQATHRHLVAACGDRYARPPSLWDWRISSPVRGRTALGAQLRCCRVVGC